MQKKQWIAAIGASFLSVTAMAQVGSYVATSISQTQIKLKADPSIGFPKTKFSPTAISITLGQQFTPNFAGEFRLGTGLGDARKDLLGVPFKVAIAASYGLYGKAILPLNEKVSIYGLIGYTKVNFRLSVPSVGIKETGSDRSSSFGFGADFAINKGTSIGVEWANLLHVDGDQFNAVSINLRRNF